MDTCPNCGYCRHCGRSNQGYPTWYNWQGIAGAPISAPSIPSIWVGTQPKDGVQWHSGFMTLNPNPNVGTQCVNSLK